MRNGGSGCALLQRVAAELRRFTFPGRAAALQVKFSGDLSQFENARVEATLRGERMQRGNYEMQGFLPGGGMDGANAQLTQLRMD